MTWFDEVLYSEWDHRGYMQRFQISRILHQTDSSRQNLIVFETPMFGRVLAIDGIIQTTEQDEFIYHEMLTHVPLFAHGNPRRVLIIGGGVSLFQTWLMRMPKAVISTSGRSCPARSVPKVFS